MDEPPVARVKDRLHHGRPDPDSRSRPVEGRSLRKYGTELVIVFVGVWLSLAAEGWRQGRNDSLTARGSTARIAQDLDSDLADLQLNLNRARAGVDNARWLLLRGVAPDAPVDSLQRALSATQFCSVFIENRGEYAALRNSGRLGIIDDADLRQRTVQQYEARVHLRFNHARDCEITATIFELMAPHVEVQEPPEERGIDGFPDASRPRVVEIVDAGELLNDRRFRSKLVELVSYRAFLMRQIALEMEGTRSLRDDLVEFAH